VNLDLLIILAGTLGALANRWAGPGPTLTRATAIESLVAGLIMVVVNALGLIPADFQAAMTENPIRVGAAVFLAAFLAGPGIITVGKGLLYKVAPGLNGGPSATKPPGQGGRASLACLVVLAALAGLLTAGCTLFGKPGDDISLNRGEAFRVALRVAELHGGLVVIAGIACQHKGASDTVVELCRHLAAGEEEYQRLKPSVERLLTDPRTTPDWQAIGRSMEILSSSIALAASVFGAPAIVPAIAGGVGGLFGGSKK
jgi:hypothetical protein